MRRSVEVTIEAHRVAGTLQPVDEALVGLARTLADAIDDETTDRVGKGTTVATLAARLMAVVLELRGEHDVDVGGDEFDRIVSALRDTPGE